MPVIAERRTVPLSGARGRTRQSRQSRQQHWMGGVIMNLDELTTEAIINRAADIGEARGFPGEAGRLRMADASGMVDALKSWVRTDVAARMTEDEVLDQIGKALWLEWVSAEARRRAS